MGDPLPRRKLAAILAADVVGFSRMMGEDENRTLRNLKACRNLTDRAIDKHHGRIFGSAGDSVIAEFASPVDAIVAAVTFQTSIQSYNSEVDEPDQMQFRVGLNLGDVIVEGNNLFGDGVNVAARLEAVADPGGISLSAKFLEEVSRKINLSFISAGEVEFKNIANPVPTFKVEMRNTSEFLKAYEESVSSYPQFSGFETPSSSVKSSESKVPAIAVLPFSNTSGDPEQGFFSDGITEDIVTNLALWRTFPVISRNSSFLYGGKSQNLKQVASELGARYIVEGSVRKGGNRVRITAQLIDAEEDHHLWSEKWDRTLEDIFDVQDEVSEAIARRVAPSVTGHEQIRLTRKRPESLSAWEEHLQGLQCFHGRQRTDHEDPILAKARQHFEQAIKLDPTLSDAHSYIAFCGFYELVHQLTKNALKTRESILEAAHRALALNPEDPLALGVIASYYMFRGEHGSAKDYAEKAIGFNPSFALNYWRLSLALVHSGEFKEAEIAAQKAVALSPVDPELGDFYTGLFLSYLGQARYKEALQAVDKTVQYYPSRGSILGIRAAILGFLGQKTDAILALNRYLVLRPNLKTRDQYRNSFIPNSPLTDPIIDGLIKAGWNPEN